LQWSVSFYESNTSVTMSLDPACALDAIVAGTRCHRGRKKPVHWRDQTSLPTWSGPPHQCSHPRCWFGSPRPRSCRWIHRPTIGFTARLDWIALPPPGSQDWHLLSRRRFALCSIESGRSCLELHWIGLGCHLLQRPCHARLSCEELETINDAHVEVCVDRRHDKEEDV
jgi:hypothetical protein